MRKLAGLPLRSKVLLVLAVASLLAAAWAARVAVVAYRTERSAFLVQRHAPRLSLERLRIDGARAVRFPSRAGEALSGYYVAPRSGGAAVVLCHGSQGERSDLAPEARILAQAGFGVLAFDWPGHGESEGIIRWGEPERRALQGALDFLIQQPGVDESRLGAYGFSMGGYIVTQVAAHDRRLRVVALAGTPPDALEHTRWEYRKLGFLRQPAAFLAQRVSQLNPSELGPEREVGRIAPRLVLVISGSDDEHVPSWMAQRLFGAAGEPKRWLNVRGAGHGGYAKADAEGYAAALLSSFGTLNDAATSSASETPAR